MDFLSTANEPSMRPKIQSFHNEISHGQQPKHKLWLHAAIFESTVYFLFLDDNICIRLCSSAGEFCAGESLRAHLLGISSFSSVVPLPLITMATSVRRSWLSYKKG